jgi:hypothetical protein
VDYSGAATLAVVGILSLLLLFGATAVFARDPNRQAMAMIVLRLLLRHIALPWSRRTPQDGAKHVPSLDADGSIDNGTTPERSEDLGLPDASRNIFPSDDEDGQVS